jgi:hypothetical protein
MRRAGLLVDGEMSLRLVNWAPELHEDDKIKVGVHAPAYAVIIRIDYFSLEGQVSICGRTTRSETRSWPPAHLACSGMDQR